MSDDETVNVHDAYSIGEGLLKGIDWQTTSEYVIKKEKSDNKFCEQQ